MESRNKEGATLALTVTCAFLIIVVGVGLFFLIQLMGGGREAQHATDAGNLNVAKQALKNPYVAAGSYSDAATLSTVDQTVEFAGLMDNPAGGPPNEINLSNYNRLVGKAFLVACNASAEGTTTAYQNAQAVLDSVEGPSGAGQLLTQQLASNLGADSSNFFYNIAHSNSLRMLNWNQQNAINNDPANYQMSYMRQASTLTAQGEPAAPTNVQLANPSNVIPSGATVTGTYSTSSTNTNNSNSYLAGYSPITVQEGPSALSIYGVPMRPGLEPHTVSQAQFTAEQTSPLVSGSNVSLIPPNAFQSQGSALEMHGGMLNTRSSAIVGSLNIQYPLSIPDGYIVINNTGALPTSGSLTVNASPADIFAGQLMTPGVYMMTAGGSGGVYYSTNPADFSSTIYNSPMSGGNVTLSSPLSSGWQPNAPSQADLNDIWNQLHGSPAAVPDQCTNQNSFPPSVADGGTGNQNCINEVGNISALYANGGGTSGSTYSNLMAIEFLKAQIIQVRGSFDGAGCGTINGAPPCTGLKAYNQNATYANILPFGNVGSSPTLSNLIAQSGGSSLTAQISQRLFEMNPNASAAQITAAFGLQVAFNAHSYIYFDPSANAYAIANDVPGPIGSPPPAWLSSSIGYYFNGPPASTPGNPQGPADGNQSSYSNSVTISPYIDTIIDVGSDGGYPHPFDCEPGDVSGQDTNKVMWQPSSGRGNYLGIVTFMDCATTGARWCCPC